MLLLGQKNEYDIVITELGGTVGDIEGLPFFEAIRQIKNDLRRGAAGADDSSRSGCARRLRPVLGDVDQPEQHYLHWRRPERVSGRD